jgi:hypothetical protein
MTPALRLALVLAIAALVPLGNGCAYRDFDLETVDHYSHYGQRHSVDATFYHGDGDDYF